MSIIHEFIKTVIQASEATGGVEYDINTRADLVIKALLKASESKSCISDSDDLDGRMEDIIKKRTAKAEKSAREKAVQSLAIKLDEIKAVASESNDLPPVSPFISTPVKKPVTKKPAAKKPKTTEKKSSDDAKKMFENSDFSICMWFFKKDSNVCSKGGDMKMVSGVPLCDKCSEKKTTNPFIAELASIGLIKTEKKRGRKTKTSEPSSDVISKPANISDMIGENTTDDFTKVCSKFFITRLPNTTISYLSYKKEGEEIVVGLIREKEFSEYQCVCKDGVNPCEQIWQTCSKIDEDDDETIKFITDNGITKYSPNLTTVFSLIDEDDFFNDIQ